MRWMQIPSGRNLGGSNQCSSHQSLVLSFLDFIPNPATLTGLERSHHLLISEQGQRDRIS
jgi:hypothetical protein